MTLKGAIPYPPLIFVAGPYFAKDHETISRNIEHANAEGQKLFNAGCLALVVHNHTHHFERKTTIAEPVYRAFDRKLIRDFVDAIKCLPNWRASQGARLEVSEMLKAGKPVFESDEALEAWRAGRPYAHVANITLNEVDERSLAIPVPDIRIAYTLGPYVTVEKNCRQHHHCVLNAESVSIELWNAGFPAFSIQRALCDFNISESQYAAFADRVLDAKATDCAVVLPGWDTDEESLRQARITQELGLPILGDAASAITFLSGKKGYYRVNVNA